MTVTYEQRGSEQHELDQRYGAPRRRLSARTKRWSIIGALAAAVGAAAWFTIDLAFGELEYNDVGYQIVSDTRAVVDYEVTKDFDATAQCALQVLDESYAVVGHRIVTIGPHEGQGAGERRQYLRSEVRTEYGGVTGIAESCWLVDQPSSEG